MGNPDGTETQASIDDIKQNTENNIIQIYITESEKSNIFSLFNWQRTVLSINPSVGERKLFRELHDLTQMYNEI